MKAAVVVVLLVASLAAVTAAPAFTDASSIQFYAWLSWAYPTAPTVPTNARGACAGRIDSNFNFELICHHNITGDPVTAAHIHGPTATPATATANVLVTLNATLEGGNSIKFAGVLSSTAYCAIFNTMTYVNVHTLAGGNGLIRGVLTPVGGTGSPTHAATLTNDQVGGGSPVPALGNYGVALITRNGNNLWTSIFHSLTATAEHYHVGATGVSGAPIDFICPNATTCIGGGWRVNQAVPEATSASGAAIPYGQTVTNDGGMYINVHSTAWPNGQIRGQVWSVAPMTTPSTCSPSSAGTVKASLGVVALLAAAVALLQ